MPWTDIKFWGVIVVAVVLKIALSGKRSIKAVAVTVMASLLLAYVATDPVILAFELNREAYAPIVGAALALTGESIVRWIVDLQPKDLIKLWRESRGGGGNDSQ